MKRKFLLFLCLPLVLGACRKTPDLDKLNLNPVVATNANKDTNFGNFNTYFISDTIRLFSDIEKDSVLVGQDANTLVSKVKANMDARGYHFVAKNASPDMGFNMSIVKNLNVYTVVYPDWWWGYWYPWYWYGWYYPPYYGWSYTYAYTTGTIYLGLVDLKDAPKEGKLIMLWDALMGGALGSTATNITSGAAAVDQAFAQSPYLTK